MADMMFRVPPDSLDKAGFMSEFGGIYEHSPWVAEAVLAEGVGADDGAVPHFAARMAAIVDAGWRPQSPWADWVCWRTRRLNTEADEAANAAAGGGGDGDGGGAPGPDRALATALTVALSRMSRPLPPTAASPDVPDAISAEHPLRVVIAGAGVSVPRRTQRRKPSKRSQLF